MAWICAPSRCNLLRPPQVVSAVIPGARTAEQARANATSMRVTIPSAVWEALKREGVIEADAPVPAAR